MQYTTNYGFAKPDTTDNVVIGNLNDNMDDIDTEIKTLADGISDINSNLIKTQTFSFPIAYDAGDIGTRGYQGTAATALTGYTPVGCFISAMASSTSYICTTMISPNGTLYLNAYRTKTTAQTASNVSVTVAYVKG